VWRRSIIAISGRSVYLDVATWIRRCRLGTIETSEFILLRVSYTNHMIRTADGWRIIRPIQHISWRDTREP